MTHFCRLCQFSGLSPLFAHSLRIPWASLLQGLTIPIVRLYEGYWQHNTRLKQSWKDRQKQRKEASKRNNEAGSDYLAFPKDQRFIMPTRLGNALAAAETYPLELYNMDGVVWWPRLITLLPSNLLDSAESCFARLVAMLHYSMIFTCLSLGGVVALVVVHFQAASIPLHLALLAISVVSPMFAYLFYNAAVSQAMDFGGVIRSAFDLHRHALLKQMDVPLPANMVEERLLWTALTAESLTYIMPWDYNWSSPEVREEATLTRKPFTYNYHTEC